MTEDEVDGYHTGIRLHIFVCTYNKHIFSACSHANLSSHVHAYAFIRIHIQLCISERLFPSFTITSTAVH